MNTEVQTYTHAHTHKHTYMNTEMHRKSHAHRHIAQDKSKHTPTDTQVYEYIRVQTNTPARAHAHTNKHRSTHAHTPTGAEGGAGIDTELGLVGEMLCNHALHLCKHGIVDTQHHTRTQTPSRTRTQTHINTRTHAHTRDHRHTSIHAHMPSLTHIARAPLTHAFACTRCHERRAPPDRTDMFAPAQSMRCWQSSGKSWWEKWLAKTLAAAMKRQPKSVWSPPYVRFCETRHERTLSATHARYSV